MSQFTDKLMWRYATKQFDPTKKIDSETWNTLKESLRLAPSSFGLEPWKFFVIETPELRTKILEASYGQKQVIEADKLVVLAAKTELDGKDVDEFIARVATGRQMDVSNLDGYSNVIKQSIGHRSMDDLIQWNQKQVYIASGFLLEAAAQHDVDACPMEGFNPSAVDEILGLRDMGYTSTMIVTLGYRSAEDQVALAPKIRYTQAEVIQVL